MDRRSLLLGSTALAQASLVPVAAGAAEITQEELEPREPRYRETEHIRTFYSRSRF